MSTNKFRPDLTKAASKFQVKHSCRDNYTSVLFVSNEVSSRLLVENLPKLVKPLLPEAMKNVHRPDIQLSNYLVVPRMLHQGTTQIFARNLPSWNPILDT